MHRWYMMVLICAVVVVIVGEVNLAVAAAVVEEHQVTAGRDTPPAWPTCLTEGRRRRTAESGDEAFQYAVVVDAGSSGSRVRVYRWPRPVGGARVAVQAPGVREIHSKKVKPGLSSHATNLEQVTDDIRSLLRDAAEHVPESAQRASPVYVMATAGQSIQCLLSLAVGAGGEGETLTPSRLFGILINACSGSETPNIIPSVHKIFLQTHG